jgi:multidrug efflux pump subunit AcrB
VPLIIYKNDLEMMGQLFNDLIFTVVISLSCSLVVAVTLVPSLCGPILKLDTRRQKPLKIALLRKLDGAMEGFFRALDNGYKAALDYCLDHRLLVLALVLLLLVFSLLQFTGIGMNMFIRSRTDDSVDISIAMPQGTVIEAAEETVSALEALIREKVQGYRNLIVTVRRSGRTQGSIQITLPPPAEQIDTPSRIIEKLTPFISEFPGSEISFRAGRSMGSTSAVEISVSSRDANAIMETAEEIRNIMIRYLPQIENPTVNLDEGAPQLQIEIDRERAAALGVSPSAVAQEIRTAMNGTTAASFSQGDKLVNINVMLREEDQAGVPNLDAIFVMNRAGERVPVANLAGIIENRSPSSIRRENQERVVRISGDLAPGIAATEMQGELEEVVGRYLIPREGVTVHYLGEAREIESYNRRFLFIIAAAVFLVFGVMASQFESFVDPLIIFFSIPLLFIGVIWIYKIGGEAMSMFSAVGIVALVGVVVNNGIVLVDYTNTLRSRGMLVREACLEAGRNRLRPILMTSLTTILGMFPIAFFPGAGADTIQPIGKTFVGGLTVSSLMTLFVTPVMYSILNSRRDKGIKAKPEGGGTRGEEGRPARGRVSIRPGPKFGADKGGRTGEAGKAK